MHKVYKPGEAPEKYGSEETCPHCDSAIPFDIDSDDMIHYEVTCPVCGKPMMLCWLCTCDLSDAGQLDDGIHDCDWCEERGCWRKRVADGK